MRDPLRVLVVDDAADYAAMLAAYLSASAEWGSASTRIASTYDDALRALLENACDVALVDYRLGSRDGVALLRDVRARGIDTPFVILTAHGAEDVAVDAMKAGAADYLPKTQVSVDALDRAIRHAVALHAGERQQQDAERALRASEERFRALVEHSSDLLILLDAEGRVQYAAPSALQHLGFTSDDLRGRSIFDLVHADDREAIAAGMAGTLANGRLLTVEVRVRCQSGGFRVMEAIAANRIQERAVGAIVINARDITERRKLEDQLRQAQKLDAVGQLASGLAYDFTNLLTAILGYCELVLTDIPHDDPKREDLEGIRTAGERAVSLTRQLLAFARQQVLQPQIVDLNAIVQQMERLLRRLLTDDVELTTTLQPQLAQVYVDPASIEQILVSLIVYARDVTPPGGRVTIATDSATFVDQAGTASLIPAGSYVRLSVRDGGDGLDAATRQRMFEPYGAAGDQNTNSLGLAAVYGLVRQSGGHIAVEGGPGEGTTFGVYLPLAHESTRDRDVDAAEPLAKPGWETILVVDSDDAVRALMREVLRRDGYTILEARHGVDAVRLAERHRDPIHLLITDSTTPHMSGRDIAERLASARPELKVLVVSGHPSATAPIASVPRSGFLRKPFTPEALARRVRVLLDR